MNLTHLSDSDVLSGLTALIGSHREILAKLVAHLAEVEDRRLHLVTGYSSLFEFCVRHLRMSEGEAFRRIVAARLGRRFPVIHSLLASGAVHLSALELLRERLTDENHREMLEAARGKTKREIEHLLAARFPKPDVASTIRKLPDSPQPQTPATTDATEGAVDPQPPEVSGHLPVPEPTDQPPVPEKTVQPPMSKAGSRGPERVEPLSETRFKVQFTASASLRDKLELARDLMSHANPSRDLAPIVERALDLLLKDLEAKKLGKSQRARQSPAKGATKAEASRPLDRPKRSHVKRADRRAVFERDGLRCTYLSPEGRRCTARAFLEFDHIEPQGYGGSDEAANGRVRCRAHNQLWAEQVYGRDQVERARHFRQRKRTHGQAGESAPSPKAPGSASVSATVSETVRRALTNMGFRDATARRAVADAAEQHRGNAEALGVERLLVAALRIVDCGSGHRITASG